MTAGILILSLLVWLAIRVTSSVIRLAMYSAATHLVICLAVTFIGPI